MLALIFYSILFLFIFEYIFQLIHSPLIPFHSAAVQQHPVPAAAAAAHAPVPRLRPLRQSGHPRHLGAADRRRPQLRLLPCDAQPDRPAARWGGHPVGVLGGLLHVPSEEVLSEVLERQSVGAGEQFRNTGKIIIFEFFAAAKRSAQSSALVRSSALLCPAGSRRWTRSRWCCSSYRPSRWCTVTWKCEYYIAELSIMII